MKELDNLVPIMKEGVEYPFLSEFLEEPSKRIRSKVAILYLKSYGKELTDEIFQILASGELIHNASLLHDDIIDDSEIRRGKTTIGTSISPKISILAGDYLVSCAMSKILKINNSKIFEIFNQTMKFMCEAEFMQYFLRGKIPSEDEYINICKGKTASLFSAVLESCAVLSNLDIEQAKKFGMEFGLHFQIKNDLETASAIIDAQNEIYTAKDVLGIEKTISLLDNCKREMKNIMGVFPVNIYERDFEGLF